MGERFFVEQVSFLALSRGVANHSRSSSHECQRFVSGFLQMPEHHYSAKVSYVQAVSRGIDSHIGCNHAFVEKFIGSGHHLMQHTAPFDFVNEIHRMIVCFLRVNV